MARRVAATKTEEPAASPVKVVLAYDGEPIYANFAEVSLRSTNFKFPLLLSQQGRPRNKLSKVRTALSGSMH
jgi:hypothetical protein